MPQHARNAVTGAPRAHAVRVGARLHRTCAAPEAAFRTWAPERGVEDHGVPQHAWDAVTGAAPGPCCPGGGLGLGFRVLGFRV